MNKNTTRQDGSRALTETVAAAWAPGGDTLGFYGYRGGDYYCDGADFLEGSKHTVCERSPASECVLQREDVSKS